MAETAPIIEVEEWREVPDCNGRYGYEVSSLGRVRNGCTKRLLRPWLAGLGYYYIRLGRGRQTSIHRLVCRVFHGEPPIAGLHVAHFDGVHTNNRVGNLRWATRSENVADSIRHGTCKLRQFSRP